MTSITETRYLCRTIRLLLLSLLMAGCAGSSVGSKEGLGTPGAVEWSQFHADGSSQGSFFVASSNALKPAWIVDVGSVVYSSPVIAADGTIYVGNLEGVLTAVNPNGTVKWRFTTPFPITSSPAVAADGTIWFVMTNPNPGFPSALLSVDPTGASRTFSILPENGFTSAAPKVWGSDKNGYVFLWTHIPTNVLPRSESALLIYNQAGELVHREDMGCTTGPVTGTSPITEGFKTFLKVLVGLFSDFPPYQFDPSGIPFHENFGWLDPTVAVVDRTDITPRDQPIIVVADGGCGTRALRWNAPNLEELWVQRHDFVLQSSPAVLNNATLVVVGHFSGKVIAYDLETGNKLWDFDTKEPIMATPASLGGLIYVASAGSIHALDPATGEEIFMRKLRGETLASPALSGNKVYVSQRNEFTTRSFDFMTTAHDDEGGGGVVSPAIGKDGTVYTVTRGNPSFLRAYPARQWSTAE